MNLASDLCLHLDHGKLLLTSDNQHWNESGIEPWADAHKDNYFDEGWRRHYLSVIVTSQIDESPADTDELDHLMNMKAFANPSNDFRAFTVWHRNNVRKINAITSD